MRKHLAFGYVAVLVGLTAVACGAPERGEKFERTTSNPRAAAGTFRSAGVSAVLEKRCGSLDCHGSEARNLRIYSGRGLRLPDSTTDAGAGVGEGDTTIEEVTANFQSIMNLEPERTNEFLKPGGDPLHLLFLKKPLELERHKGGAVMKRGDDTERCITSWLTASTLTPVNSVACSSAALFPRE